MAGSIQAKESALPAAGRVVRQNMGIAEIPQRVMPIAQIAGQHCLCERESGLERIGELKREGREALAAQKTALRKPTHNDRLFGGRKAGCVGENHI